MHTLCTHVLHYVLHYVHVSACIYVRAERPTVAVEAIAGQHEARAAAAGEGLPIVRAHLLTAAIVVQALIDHTTCGGG